MVEQHMSVDASLHLLRSRSHQGIKWTCFLLSLIRVIKKCINSISVLEKNSGKKSHHPQFYR